MNRPTPRPTRGIAQNRSKSGVPTTVSPTLPAQPIADVKIEPMDERISVIFVHFLSLFFFTISVFLLLRNVSKAARTYKVKHNANNKAHQHHSYKIYNRFRKQPVGKLPKHLNIEVKHFRHVSSPPQRS